MNILILGATGNLGSSVYKLLLMLSIIDRRLKNINALSRYDISNLVFPIDLTDYESVKAYLFDNAYNIVINCLAYTNTTDAENHTKGYNDSYTSNVIIPDVVSKACADLGIKFIHISTDYVNSELSYKYNCPFPINTYGVHKLLAETKISKNYLKYNSTDYLIIRTSWLYNVGSPKNQSFVHKALLQSIIATIKNNCIEPTTFNFANNIYSFPTSVDNLSRFILWECLEPKYFNTIYFTDLTEHNSISTSSEFIDNFIPITPVEFANTVIDNINTIYNNNPQLLKLPAGVKIPTEFLLATPGEVNTTVELGLNYPQKSISYDCKHITSDKDWKETLRHDLDFYDKQLFEWISTQYVIYYNTLTQHTENT